jgi:ABC-type lipoprotein export system ATPase subunit
VNAVAARERGDALIVARDLAKIYAAGTPREVRALDGVSFRIAAGEYVAIVGESGSGKSTLMQLLGALDRADAGSLSIDGVDVRAASGGELTTLRATRIGFVFQGFNLIPALDALENVALAATYAGLSRAEALRRARAMLDRVGLADRSHHRPTQLSGGQQQRVAIARALVNAPALVLADEPTGELDSRTAGTILDLLEELNREHGVTLAIVTHSDAVFRRAQRTIRLADGRVVADESVAHA